MAEQQRKTADTDTPKDADLGQQEVQDSFDEAREKGYFGETPRQTPNEFYTLANQGDGGKRPEEEQALLGIVPDKK